MTIRLMVGLGNPGPNYVDTRHNIGFKFINALLKLSTIETNKKTTLRSHLYQPLLNGERLFCIKPQTFMNLSGESVLAVMNYYRLTPANICVVFDDLDLDFGRVRLRGSGSAGTHNGLKSVILLPYYPSNKLR